MSMGLGPISAIYQAHFNRYLHHRRLVDTSASRVWCFVGDGEMDEPESVGALGVAGREHLDNLIFVVNCNLQRLDGPVRGNGKIIQELEALYRGAGWNVIKVIWGSRWDELLARDVDGVLLDKMNTTVDGEFQKYATESGAYIREHFFGPDPRLRKMVEHLSDDELRSLPRGGHDYRKLYAAYKLATEQRGAPTVILAKTIKGWTLGPQIEARNATHQIKKMTKDQLRTLRDRLYLADEIPDAALEADEPPYYRPPEGSEVHEYLMARRKMLAGAVPRRVVRPARGHAPGPEGLRRPGGRLGQAGRVDDHGVRPPAAQPGPRPGVRPARRPDRLRRGPHVRPGADHRRGEDLRARRPAVRAGRRRPAAEVRREHVRPAPPGGHHRGRGHGVVHRPGDVVRHLGPADAAGLPLLFDVRLPAGRRPGCGPSATCAAAASWPAARPGGPRSSARASSTTTAIHRCWPRRTRPPRSTTRRSPTRSR